MMLCYTLKEINEAIMAVQSWAVNPQRDRSEYAFTAGVARNIAFMVEQVDEEKKGKK